MAKILRSLLLTAVGLALFGVGVANSQTGSAGYYEFSTYVRFLRDVVVVGDSTVSGNLTVAGDMAAGQIRYTPQVSLTVTMNGYITPTGSFQPLTAGAAVGLSNVAAGTAGDVVVLYNVGSNTITLTDTGTLKLAGNAALGQDDTLSLISDGTNWLETSRANN